MASYKLSYFNVTGLAEPIRFLLSYADIDFEDFRMNFEDWPEIKPTMPMGKVPTFEFDDKVYHQSRAIGRYVARQCQLYGSGNELRDMEIDMCIEDIDEWRDFFANSVRSSDPEQKATLMELALEKTPWYLDKFEQRVVDNDGYFVGGEISWADVQFAATAEVVSNMAQKELLIKDYPALQQLYDTVRSLPKIEAYLEKRPETQF